MVSVTDHPYMISAAKQEMKKNIEALLLSANFLQSGYENEFCIRKKVCLL